MYSSVFSSIFGLCPPDASKIVPSQNQQECFLLVPNVYEEGESNTICLELVLPRLQYTVTNHDYKPEDRILGLHVTFKNLTLQNSVGTYILYIFKSHNKMWLFLLQIFTAV